MEKYVLGLFIFVAVVAFAGFLTNVFPTEGSNIQGALWVMNGRESMQRGAIVTVGRTTSIQWDGSKNTGVKLQEGPLAKPAPTPKKVTPAKTAKTGLIIQNGLGYTQTPMQGMVLVKGISISVNTLQEKGITLASGKLLTPRGEDVQIRDVELRRKPVKLSKKK